MKERQTTGARHGCCEIVLGHLVGARATVTLEDEPLLQTPKPLSMRGGRRATKLQLQQGHSAERARAGLVATHPPVTFSHPRQLTHSTLSSQTLPPDASPGITPPWSEEGAITKKLATKPTAQKQQFPLNSEAVR